MRIARREGLVVRVVVGGGGSDESRGRHGGPFPGWSDGRIPMVMAVGVGSAGRSVAALYITCTVSGLAKHHFGDGTRTFA